MTEQRSVKSLAAKLVKVMEAVDYIPKRGRNVTQNYDYATDADIADTVRTEMAKQRVVMLPKVTSHSVRQIKAKDRDININTVEMEFTFIDADSGESFTVATVGEGMDSGDKGCYKAMTGATKYALLKSFQIPTGDDPEKDNGDEEPRRTETQYVAAKPPTAAPASSSTGQAGTKAAPRAAKPLTLPYGKSKGKTLAEAAFDDLTWFHGTLTEDKLADMTYGESNRKLKQAIEDELDRRQADQTPEAAAGMDTEEQPDAPTPERLSPQQRNAMFAIARKRAMDENALDALIAERYGVQSKTELTKQQASDLIEHLQALTSQAPAASDAAGNLFGGRQK